MARGNYLTTASEALLLNRVRSVLTMLGVVIGVFAVIVMVGLGQGSQAYITDQVKGLGAGVLIVTPGNPKTQRAFGPPGVNVAQTLTLADAKALESLPGVRFVAPNAFVQAVVKAGRERTSAMVLGGSVHTAEVRGFTFAEGRFYNEQEERLGTRVAVLGGKLAKTLFPTALISPLDGKVELEGQRYRVIGVLAESGSGLFGSVDEQVFVPMRAFQTLLKTGERVNSLMVKVESDLLLPAVGSQLEALLRQRHALRPDEDDDFKLQTQAELLATISVITGAFTVLLGGIAAISLLVGGIGIMNVMLVSVTERTREIGLRKAVGAKYRDLLAQFLLEAATLSLTGGAIGIVLGLVTIKLVAGALGLPFVFSLPALVGAFAFSAAVGLFFGIYPAHRAARLDPVDALRHE